MEPINSNNPFPSIRFAGELRQSQSDAVAIIERQLKAGQKRLHVVAPPGSGKTVLGLYVWACLVKKPALVLSPNSAIQSQWVARTSLFDFDETQAELSDDPKSPGLLTSLTYQSVTLPARNDGDLDAQAINWWQEKLIETRQASDPDEATLWIADLKRHNQDYYQQRLSAYRKQVREMMGLSGETLQTLHASSLATLRRLREAGLGLIILDECHHLMGHWGRVLADAHELLDEPIILGLTATPPEHRHRNQKDIARYQQYFGPVDFEVPIPALVRERHLSPYQDLAYFVRPTAEELSYVAKADEQLKELVETLCTERDVEPAPDETVENNVENDVVNDDSVNENVPEPLPVRIASLPKWLYETLEQYRLPTGSVGSWLALANRDPALTENGRLFLTMRDIDLPANVPPLDESDFDEEIPEIAILIPVLDRYIRHGLMRSPHPKDHELAKWAVSQLRQVGVQVTETGTQACASPVGRVMAYSKAKAQAIVPILHSEMSSLGKQIRAVVVTDFEKSSALKERADGVLDEEAGGAVAVFRQLLSDEKTDQLDPILLTGSTVLVDDDMLPRFMEHAKRWLAEMDADVELTSASHEGFEVISGSGQLWSPRIYVNLITDLFQQGITRCLVGTRGLLGEGWDANKINVLIDLTTVTTSMTVNQLRGRSFRLDPTDPKKIANNWDVVCVADEFTKGLDDYGRFCDKHEQLFGVTDDGAIEKGVGHVHAAFTKIKPEALSSSYSVLNMDMLTRAGDRDHARSLWRIGEPYEGEPISVLEMKLHADAAGGFPPFTDAALAWRDDGLVLAIGQAVIGALLEAELIESRSSLQCHQRSGGYVRLFMDKAKPADARLFLSSVRQAMGSIDQARYVVPRLVDQLEDTWLSELLPQVMGKYFRKKRRRLTMLHAVPIELARNGKLAALFQRHWNEHVSPGKVAYTLSDQGKSLLERARAALQNRMVVGKPHEKEIFT